MSELDDMAVDAIDLVAEICGLAEYDELPDRAWDFAESVAERARDIEATVERMGTATEGQMMALENMRDGLRKWL